jgi:hypothetical protein
MPSASGEARRRVSDRLACARATRIQWRAKRGRRQGSPDPNRHSRAPAAVIRTQHTTIEQERTMNIHWQDTAILFTDPQDEVLSEQGGAWKLVRDSVRENKTVERGSASRNQGQHGCHGKDVTARSRRVHPSNGVGLKHGSSRLSATAWAWASRSAARLSKPGRLWATRCEPRGALFQFTIPAD